jgi:hypothetical protein
MTENPKMSRVTRFDNFSSIGLLFESNWDFLREEVAQRNGNILGYFLHMEFLHFVLNNLVSKHGLLRVLKGLM